MRLKLSKADLTHALPHLLLCPRDEHLPSPAADIAC